MEYKCQFCDKIFSTKSNLNCHIKTAKICINNRNDNKVEIKSHTCEHCEKKFTTKNKLNNHISICSEYINKKKHNELMSQIRDKNFLLEQKDLQINQLKEQVKDLQDRNQELALRAIDKPSIGHQSNNTNKQDNHSVNTYNQLQSVNLTPEYLYAVLDKNLKIEHIYQGQRGLADVVAKNVLTDENGRPLAFCNDKSRQMIKYKNSDGEIIKDAKAYNLVSSIAPVAEEIAIKRKREFENAHYKKEDKKEEIRFDEGFIDENGDFFGFEDEVIEEQINEVNDERDIEIKTKKVQNIINQIETWDNDKRDYYFNKLIRGITNLQILNVNSNIFSKQLSIILPSESLS